MATLRPPRSADAGALSDLMRELGYPVTPEQVVSRLRELGDHPGASAIVAELDGTVVGYAQAHVFPSLHLTAPAAWLTALVVSSRVRGRGIGQELVTHVERWVRERGAEKISLTSALHRESAHGFYRALGYSQTGVRLTKQFAAR